MPERRNWTLVSCEFDDGERLHREALETFWIPDEERRQSLAAGDLVKLIFMMIVRDPDTGHEQVDVERMWVIVERGGRDRCQGVLDNDPYCTRDLAPGAVVEFEPRHVIQIYEEKPAVGGTDQ